MPWPAAGAEAGGLPSRPQRDGTGERKHNGSQGQGLRSFLSMSVTREPRAGRREETLGWGGRGGAPRASGDAPRRMSRKRGPDHAEGALVSHVCACTPARARAWSTPISSLTSASKTGLRASAVGRGTPTRDALPSPPERCLSRSVWLWRQAAPKSQGPPTASISFSLAAHAGGRHLRRP